MRIRIFLLALLLGFAPGLLTLTHAQTTPSEEFKQALAEMKARRWEQARSILDKLVRSLPDNLAARNNLAVCLIKLRRYDEAEAHLQQVLRVDPTRAGSRLNMGVNQQGKQETSKALESTNEALDLYSKQKSPEYWRAVALFNRGWLLDDQSQLEEALRDRKSSSPPAANALIKRSVKLLTEAIQAYEEAIKLRPTYAKAWLCLAVAYGRLGRVEEAKKALAEAERWKGDDPDIGSLIEPNRKALEGAENTRKLLEQAEKESVVSSTATETPPSQAGAVPRGRTFLADGLMGTTGLWDWSPFWSMIVYLAAQFTALGIAIKRFKPRFRSPPASSRRGAAALGCAMLGIVLLATCWGFSGWPKWVGFAVVAAVNVGTLSALGIRPIQQTHLGHADTRRKPKRQVQETIPPLTALDFIRWNCPSCAKKLKAAGDLAGKLTKCPKCNRRQRIPGMS